MMTDIVVRLRNVGGFDPVAELCSEAADAIEALRLLLKLSRDPKSAEEVVRLRAALGEGKE